jgi:hypothetical protein
MGRFGGTLTEENSVTITVRVPRELAEAINETAGSTNVAAWCRALFRQATSRGMTLAGAAGVEQSEGWRAGWDAANRQFRRALQEVLASPEPEP